MELQQRLGIGRLTNKFFPLYYILYHETTATTSCILLSLPAAVRKPIKVACVGNSVTFGYKRPDREHQAYLVNTANLPASTFRDVHE